MKKRLQLKVKTKDFEELKERLKSFGGEIIETRLGEFGFTTNEYLIVNCKIDKKVFNSRFIEKD